MPGPLATGFAARRRRWAVLVVGPGSRHASVHSAAECGAAALNHSLLPEGGGVAVAPLPPQRAGATAGNPLPAGETNGGVYLTLSLELYVDL